MIFPLVLGALLLTSCGTTALQRLDIVGTGVKSAWSGAYKSWSAKCDSEAYKCRAAAPASQPVALKDCPGAAKCITGLEHYSLTLAGVDRAIMVAAPLVVKDDPTAGDYVDAAAKALEQALKLATDAGVMR